jgi:hypothetical protein
MHSASAKARTASTLFLSVCPRPFFKVVDSVVSVSILLTGTSK